MGFAYMYHATQRGTMSNQHKEVIDLIQSMAEEQTLFLQRRYKMAPSDIIALYTGRPNHHATYNDAVQSVALFNMQNAARQGFVAS
jgi:hypothetical protein